jgi:hypothetical protein
MRPMSVGTNYSTPVVVNGFRCKNCTDVDNAKKHIDPAHPRSGPYGINAADDPTVKQTVSVTFGGALVDLSQAAKDSVAKAAPSPGAQLDISA